jgi:hypothetical protein
LAVLFASTSCIEWDRSTNTEVRDLTLFVSSVRTLEGREGTFSAGPAPTAAGGPTVSANLPQLVLKGGAAQVTFTSPTPFTRLVVAAQGYNGFFTLDLTAPTTSATVLVLYAQEVGAPAFDLRYAAGAGGVLGAYSTANTAFIGNGTGEVQVNITWNTPADVDLYVVDPFGAEIYYAARGAPSGGQLDIDSNAACGSDGPRAENIFWPFGVVPPRGLYTVRVNNWSACSAAATDYVVTIRTKDGVAQVYTGRLTGPGNGGAGGAGQQIGEFRY